MFYFKKKNLNYDRSNTIQLLRFGDKTFTFEIEGNVNDVKLSSL